MFMYFLLPHWVPATWRSRAQTSIKAEFPSGNVPTTRVRLRTYTHTTRQKQDEAAQTMGSFMAQVM